MKSLDLQISEKTKGIARVVQIEEKVERMRGMVSNMNKFKSALVETESSLRNRLVGSINALMQEVWTADIPLRRLPCHKAQCRQGRLPPGGGDRRRRRRTATGSDLNGVASGGEKSIACLAMRISMSMVIVPNLRWLILDEPTHNIDENGINRLVQILGSRCRGSSTRSS